MALGEERKDAMAVEHAETIMTIRKSRDLFINDLRNIIRRSREDVGDREVEVRIAAAHLLADMNASDEIEYSIRHISDNVRVGGLSSSHNVKYGSYPNVQILKKFGYKTLLESVRQFVLKSPASELSDYEAELLAFVLMDSIGTNASARSHLASELGPDNGLSDVGAANARKLRTFINDRSVQERE